MTRTRVLHLIWALDLGGAERQVLEIVRGLDRSRFEPVVGCVVRKGRWGEALEKEGIRVIDLAKRPGFDPWLLFRLVRLLRQGGFQILHTHAFTAASWGRLAALLARTPVVVAHEHSAFSLDSAVRRTVDRALAIGTSRWVVVSEALARDLLRVEHLPLPRLVLVRNGISFPAEEGVPVDVPAVRKELGASGFRELVGSVGRLEQRKGLEVLIEAVCRLAPGRPGLGAVLVGDGPLRGALEEKVRSLGLADRVVLAGRREDVYRVLRSLDVFALPSHTEGLSISLLEAAAAGCPIVATNVGGNAEVVEDGQSGILVPAGSPEALAGAIERLLDDRAAARALGEAAERTVRDRFASSAMVRSIEGLYVDLLQPRDGSARARFKAVPNAGPKRLVRRLLARAARRFASPPLEPTLRILTYHRVNDRHPGDRMSVHPLAFREQMEVLAATGRPVLPLEEALARLRSKADPLPRGAVSITFDDGYRDNLEFAAPTLARLGFRATVFLVTGRMGVPVTIDRYLGCCEEDGALSWEEARELGDRGHALGGHGRTHRELASLDPESLRDEVLGCQEDLCRQLGSPSRLFCYPRGSENEAVREVVSEAGFQAAVTVYPGVSGARTDPLLLRRTEVSGADEITDFHLKLDGAFDALHRAWQRARPRGA